MNYNQLILYIATWIKENHNNEITGDILQEVLVEMIQYVKNQDDDFIIDIQDLQTQIDNINITGGVKVHEGVDDPNFFPPSEPYSSGDIFVRTNGFVYIYNGVEWLTLMQVNVNAILKEINIPDAGVTDKASLVSYINSLTPPFEKEPNDTVCFTLQNGIRYLFANKASGKYGDGEQQISESDLLDISSSGGGLPNLNDGIIQISEPELIPDPTDPSLLSLKIPNSPLIAEWRINGIEYTHLFTKIIPIPYASAGDKFRTDIVVANKHNDFERIEGVESSDAGVPPTIPEGTILITEVNVYGNNITVTPPPESGYIKKLSKQYRAKNLYNPLYNVLYIDADNTTFWVQAGAGDSINGFTEGDFQAPLHPLYDGMDVFINAKTAVTLIHQDPIAPIKFYFADGNDLVVVEKSIVHLKWNKTNGRMELVGVSSDNQNLNPDDYDLDQFKNESQDPYVRYSNLPAPFDPTQIENAIQDLENNKQPKDLVYPTIADMIAAPAQPNQAEGVVIRVDDAGEDTRITFPVGASKVAYYQKLAGSTESLIDDYVLISAPFGNVSTGLYTIPQSGTDIGKLDLSNPLGLDATTNINEVENLSIKTGSVVGGNITFRSRTTLRPTIAGATEQVYLSEPSANFDNTATYTIVVWKEADKTCWLMRNRS